MKLLHLRRSRFFMRAAAVLLLALLCQHAAIAAYACPVDRTPANLVEAMPDCSGMAEADPAALCEKHCNPDESTFAGPHAGNVPAGVLPPLRFDVARTLPGGPGPRLYESVPTTRSDPPPTLRFCSLLI